MRHESLRSVFRQALLEPVPFAPPILIIGSFWLLKREARRGDAKRHDMVISPCENSQNKLVHA